MLNIRQLLVLICAIGTTGLYGMNLMRPYQILLRPPKPSNTFVQMYGISYFGFGSRAFGIEGDHVDALQLYECYQNALTMLDGFSTCSTIGQLSARIDAESDCNRGRFAPCGTFAVDGAANFGLRFFFNHDISFACYMPYYKMRLHDVFWRDLTGNTTMQDVRTHAYLTDCICQKTSELGDLNIGDWSRSGIGDTTVSLEWISDFPQHREMLRNVTLNSRLGMTIPTALKRDEDKILAFSYGNDGAIGIVFAFGIDLFLGRCVKAGLDVELMHTFGNNRCRRIKTSTLQTELFLLQKAPTFRDFGLTQQFSLYWQLYNIGGASFEIAYQYYKCGRDELSLTSNEFSSLVANSSLELIGYTTHDIFLIASYDFERYMYEGAGWSPYAAVFVDIPFNGKRAVVSRTAGFTLGINF